MLQKEGKIMGSKRTFYLLVMLLALSITVYGCGGDGGGGGVSPVAGIYTINTSGGDGGPAGGSGRSAGDVELYAYYGSGGPLEILKTGAADASWTPSTAVANLGGNPLAVTADTTIQVLGAEPAAGTPYLIANIYSLYISDGDGAIQDETPVTGISVASGATLTLGLNYNTATGARIEMSYDIDNHGTITTEDASTTARGDLRLYMASYLGNSSIDTSGTLDGQDGGYVYLSPNISFFNNGTINTSGAGSTTATVAAGDGGYVRVYVDYWLENTGDITTDGGTASGAGTTGGSAGALSLGGPFGLFNSGNLSTRGGNGVTGGGSGNYLELGVWWFGDLRNSGNMDTSGGDATATGSGGDGERIGIYSYGGDLINSGDLTTTGGTTVDTASSGGDGGDISVYISSGYDAPGDILFSGNINTSGGDAVTSAGATGSGGYGGDVYLEGYYYNYPEGQRIALLGYTGVDTSGGDGNFGGDANGVYMYNNYTDTAGVFGPGGNVTNEVDISAIGGSVLAGATTTPANGGDGGYLDMETDYYFGMLNSSTEKVVNSGNVNASGGNSLENNSAWYAEGGGIYLWGYNGVTNSGNVIANGGDDSGTDGGTTGIGGYGGWIGMYAQGGPVNNSGTFSLNGGYGEYQGGGSDGLEMFGPKVKNSGDVTGTGGGADASLAGSTGGDGADVELLSIDVATNQTGTVTNTGGAGETNGVAGMYILDGVIQ